MKKSMSYSEAVKAKKELEYFIKLVDHYQPKNIDQWIIKYYAITNSIIGVLRLAYLNDMPDISREKIKEVLNKKEIDELHNLIKKNYKNKSKKRKRSNYVN